MCTQPEVSLDSATVTGPGAAIDLGRNYAYHAVVYWSAGSPSSVEISLDISHDGEHWVNVHSASNASSGVLTAQRVARYVRARLWGINGGTSPAVTATVASA